MKINILLILLFNLNITFSQSGQILKNQVLKSSVLKKDVYYNAYLPPNYNTETEYPVMYYLHGFGGNNNSSNRVMKAVDSLIIKNEFPPIIVITPNGEKSWYLNDFAGKFNYSTMFIREFIPSMKKKYQISNDKNKAIIAGLSMGGFGALRFSMLHPNEFGICVTFMAALNTIEQIYKDSEEDYQKYLHNIYGENLKPLERVNSFFINNNPLYLVEKIDLEILKNKKWYIQSCDNDYHSLPNAELHITFHKLKIEHEFRVIDGGHNGKCVNSSMNDALEFIKKNITAVQP